MLRGDCSTMMPDDTITRAFAWARAYLAVQNTMAANMCLRRVLKTTVPADMNDRGHDAVQLATDIAMQYMLDGDVDAASKLLGFAASWNRGELEARSETRAEKTVVARNPLKRLPPPKPPPKPEQARNELTEPGRGKREPEAPVGRFEDDATRIYRPGSRTASGTVITHTILCLRPDVDRIP